MNPKKLAVATALAIATFTGVARADLAADLQIMPASKALMKAVQNDATPVDVLIADAAAQLQGNPELLSALISEAVKSFPHKAVLIVQRAISQAPGLRKTITDVAVAALSSSPDAQRAIQKGAQQVVISDQADNAIETVAENTEEGSTPIAAKPDKPSKLPPPPRSPQRPASEPPSVSPSA